VIEVADNGYLSNREITKHLISNRNNRRNREAEYRLANSLRTIITDIIVKNN